MKKSSLAALLAVSLALVVTQPVLASAAPVAPYETNSECLECHDVAVVGQSVSKVDFTAATVDYAACFSCHWIGMGDLIKGRWRHQHLLVDPGSACEDCHYGEGFEEKPAGYRTPTFATAFGYFDGAGSLATDSDTLHGIHVNGSWPRNAGFFPNYCASCHGPASCSTCHSGAIPHGDHTSGAYPAATYPQATGTTPNNPNQLTNVTAPSTCANDSCHPPASASPQLQVPVCGSCHPANASDHGYSSVDHEADVGLTSDPGSPTCETCHEMDVFTEHERYTSAAAGGECATCHVSPRDSFVSWDQGCEQGGCHSIGSDQERHGDLTTTHVSTFTDSPVADCSACHDQDLTVVHGAPMESTTPSGTVLAGCDICHEKNGGALGQTTQDATSVDHDTRCSTCHADYHAESASHKAVQAASVGNCGVCHDDGPGAGLGVQGIHSGAIEGPCAVCHSNVSRVPDITAKTAECSSCHASEGVDHHRNPNAHISSQSDCSGAGCHAIGDMATLHESEVPTTVFADGFESGDFSAWDPPTGFQGFINSTDPSTWNPSAPDQSYRVHSGTYSVTIRSGFGKTVSAAGATELKLGFWLRGDAGISKNEYMTVSISPNGTDWTSAFYKKPTSFGPGWQYFEIPIADSFATDSFQFRFGSYLGLSDVDDISLTAMDPGPSPTMQSRCDRCHTATAPTPGSDCYSCHSSAVPGHSNIHAPSKTHIQHCMDECHVAPDIQAIHASRPEGPCAVCHDNPTRGNVAWSRTTACGDCHPLDAGHQYHVAVPGHIAVGQEACTGNCHHGSTDVSDLHLCGRCHGMTDTASASTACPDCHLVEGSPTFHPRADIAHIRPIDADTQLCLRCHTGQSDVRLIHGADRDASCDVCHASNCTSCHWFRARGTIEWVYGPGSMPTTKCQNCHGAGSTTWYLSHAGSTVAHNFTGGSSCVGTQCHVSQSLPAEHDAHMASYPAYEDSCALCHLNTNGGRINWLTATSDCSTCHTLHEPRVVPAYGTVSGTVTDSVSGLPVSGAAVSLDGKNTTTAANGTYSFADLALGTHALSITKAGYTAYNAPVTVLANQNTQADASLIPASSGNLTLGGTLSSTRYATSSYRAANAGDGSTSTRWWTGWMGGPTERESITVDLGAVYSIDKVEILWHQSLWAKNFRVQSSTGAGWADIKWEKAGSPGTYSFTFAPRSARYVRVECRETGTGDEEGYSITELRIFGR